MGRARSHKQVAISYGTQWARVDKGLAPLIQDLWWRGIDTYSCCQGGVGSPRVFGDDCSAYIEFADTAGAASFVNALIAGRKGSRFYRRVTNAALLTHPYLNEWEYLASPELVNDAPATIRFGVSISFPPSDIAEILRRIRGSRKA